MKSTPLNLQTPTFPIPGSVLESFRPITPENNIPAPSALKKVEVEEKKPASSPKLLYTPDEEEKCNEEKEEDKSKDKADAKYVKTFNNSVYPNGNYPTFGSVIGEFYDYF